MIPLLPIAALSLAMLADDDRKSLLARVAMGDWDYLLDRLGPHKFADLVVALPPGPLRDRGAAVFMERVWNADLGEEVSRHDGEQLVRQFIASWSGRSIPVIDTRGHQTYVRSDLFIDRVVQDYHPFVMTTIVVALPPGKASSTIEVDRIWIQWVVDPWDGLQTLPGNEVVVFGPDVGLYAGQRSI